jgi:hypothetical protein
VRVPNEDNSERRLPKSKHKFAEIPIECEEDPLFAACRCQHIGIGAVTRRFSNGDDIMSYRS